MTAVGVNAARIRADGLRPMLNPYLKLVEETKIVSGWTDYGSRFCSAISRENLFATQFHPEKSDRWGIKVLRNFGKIVSRQEDE